MPTRSPSFVPARGPRAASAALLILCLAGSALAGDLASGIRGVLTSAKVGQARIGISIVDVTTGASLVAIHADDAFIPASNMKLLSSGTALLVLGGDYHFKTTFALDADRLVITGSGDPAFADPEVLRSMDPPTSVEDVLSGLVGAIAKVGTRSLKEIVLDDRIFDRIYVHPSWSTHHLLNAYGSEVCGLNFHHNIIRYFPKPNPAGPGAAPILNIEPAAPFLSIANKAETVQETRNTLWMSRPFDSNAIAVQGQIGGSQNIEKNVTIHDGATFFGRVLADRLNAAGITITGASTAGAEVRLATPDDNFSSDHVVAIVSTPMADVLVQCNAHSENMYAESLLKAVGHAITKEPGSWANGTTVIRMMLSEKVGPAAAANTIIVDGSGLSRDDAVSPATFTSWLRVLGNSTSADLFVASLAHPGKPGTLQKRFRPGSIKLENELAAKSGLLTNVRSLSGYLTNTATGHRLAFSILANDVTGDADQAVLKLHEDVVHLADQYLSEITSTTTTTKAGE